MIVVITAMIKQIIIKIIIKIITIMWDTFWKRVWTNVSYHWYLVVKILRRLIWRDRYFSLSLILFLFSMEPLSLILRKVNASNGESKNTTWIICCSWMIWSCFPRVTNKEIHLWKLFMSLVLILGWSLEQKDVEFLRWREEK